MGKKDFSATFKQITQTVQEPQQVQEVQKTPTEQEIQKAQAEQQTQGKKGYKMQRINMAFTPDNIEYIRAISKLKGLTMTQYINSLVDSDRLKNAQISEQLKELLKSL